MEETENVGHVQEIGVFNGTRTWKVHTELADWTVSSEHWISLTKTKILADVVPIEIRSGSEALVYGF